MTDKKERHVMWFSPSTVQKLDASNVFAGCKSRSEFAERAIIFYAGYLSAQNHSDFLADVVTQAISGVVSGAENRIARMQFKEAVELAKLTHMLASINEVDDETLRRLHVQCVDEVRRINGVVRYEVAVKSQQIE
ncbi:hypothetical protein LJC34_03770 [Oscillospiraceae bacterium OttesenSCG-928-G22]|nr:hypothetical protein [Oscillospiraceae bacterium OttesenSCG-928-G22]